MSPLGAILWLWLLVSLSVYGYRLYRRFSRSSEAAADAAVEPGTGDRARPAGPATALIENPIAGFEQPPSASESTPGSLPTAMAPADPPAPVAPVLPVSGADAVAPPAPAAPAAPSWTPPPGGGDIPSAMPASERRAPRRPVSEVVEGIQLPCALVPLVGDATRLDPFDIAFSTTASDEQTVRGAMAGELVRLGYQVTPSSAHRLNASRADAELAVTVYGDPAKAVEAGRTLYPTAMPGSVVVRMQT